MRAAVAALLVIGCGARQFAPAPVYMAPEQPARHACTLPPVPEPPQLVGYPSAMTIYVTIDDLAAMVRATAQTSDWLRAAAQCFADSAPARLEAK